MLISQRGFLAPPLSLIKERANNVVLLILIGANLINGEGGKRVSGDQFCCSVPRRDGVRIYLLNADGLLDQ